MDQQAEQDTQAKLVVSELHPGVTQDQIVAATGWPVRFSDQLRQTPPANETELSTLRDLVRRTDLAHRPPASRLARTQRSGDEECRG